MAQQTTLTSNVENIQVVDPAREVNIQPIQPYRSPEVVDLGKASELLQGGSIVGADNSSQTYGR